MDATTALAAMGGVAAWRSLRRRGVACNALDRARRQGGVLRLAHGVYALPDADPTSSPP
jgi:hypothetical protein